MTQNQSFDLLLRNARLREGEGLQDIAVRHGRIAAIGPALAGTAALDEDVGGRLVLPGLVDTHIHLDKSCLLCRCRDAGGGLRGAIAAVSGLKRAFTTEDVYARGARTLERAITQGTMFLRAHVELDPLVGLRSFEAMKRLKREYAFAVDLSICVFPQEGMTHDPAVEGLLTQALAEGADLLGGCPYTDADPSLQMERIFALAVAHDVDLDFHLDFDLDPSWSHLEEICRRTMAAGWQGRVAVGHATKLAAIDDAALARMIALLADAGVGVTALPATDLYLNGRDAGHRAPRGVAPVHLLAEGGVTVSVATNNVLNPFTPFGDGSLLRIGNLYANLMHLGPESFGDCLEMISTGAARLMRIADYGIMVGGRADLIVLDADDEADAFGGIAPPLMGFKHGRRSFVRPAAMLVRP
ncbi:amidohydrolase [Azospirillum sp. TSH100]|uniref:amidohydrolase family protein n=1 Tax=Azospirillum sp. TSH100 TaxID=652764 RepID=UPI000D619C05|nr:amidohydrolase family protein [Azospirillum sp. TSH100]PWC91467.1 amidohydrolase [Azospirillum sp. TSH100]QCG89098.1 amidohydrolase [Azospirillum sp. TSH100]